MVITERDVVVATGTLNAFIAMQQMTPLTIEQMATLFDSVETDDRQKAMAAILAVAVTRLAAS